MSIKVWGRSFLLVVVAVFAASFLLAYVQKTPQAGEVHGVVQDEWDTLEGTGVLGGLLWTKDSGDAAVLRGEARQLFALLTDKQGTGGAAGLLTRGELYRYLAEMAGEEKKKGDTEYYLAVNPMTVPTDVLARLGVVDVPEDRIFRDGSVSRGEVVTAAARVLEPQLRTENSPAVVQPVFYTYGTLEADLASLAALYPEQVTLEVIGESVEGRKIYAARLGTGGVNIQLDAAMHAREWLTTPLLMKMLENYAHHAKYGYELGGYDVAVMLEDVTFWFVPMVNPDGVTLVLEGPNAVKNGDFVREIKQNETGEEDFADWKANIRGVDLNRQFPVRWDVLRNVKTKPSASHFKGYEPLSEPEAVAMMEFTRKHLPAVVLTYHQRGDYIYWYYGQEGAVLKRDARIARELAAVAGYGWEYYGNDGGMYRDWIITELGLPALIMEVGQKLGDFGEWDLAWRRNSLVGLRAAELVME
ncbi:MAG: M14 family zinc carboxypeptidase [Bacillota bacterium]|nr:M14 family zinc carboxypeptidase [Bacillota bacterium]MDW7685312.1 M14 family zinc carboxypeptidase [Bacillota bacterium]